MSLNPEEIARILERLQSKWASARCPMCGTNQWLMLGHVTLTLGDSVGDLPMVVRSQVMPCVAMICQTCGNTLLINIAIIGLASPA
jgi:hypothetical protein